jgi:hypothetical protein
MGADGGIVITKVQSIKDNWPKVKDELIKWFEGGLAGVVRRDESWNVKTYTEAVEACKNLPDDVKDCSGEDIVKLLGFAASCECPYLFEDNIITGQGDYVWDLMDTLSHCLCSIGGTRIETWT